VRGRSLLRMGHHHRVAAPTPAVAALLKHKIDHRLHEHRAMTPAGPPDGRDVAAVLAVDASRVFKTLVVVVGDRAAIAVLPVTATLDLRLVAAALRAKRAEMAEPTTAERITGARLGAISPVGLRRRPPIVVDATVTDWPTVFVSGGRRDLELEIAPTDLLEVTGARLAPITRQH
jgi:Cys-tRNA(Pro)/Cys-tRNA(Cys) deacylase